MGDQPDARPLPTRDNTTQKRSGHIHVPNKIRTCDPNVRAAEDSTCLKTARPLGPALLKDKIVPVL
jgi:hypothetical protein